jgi:hypothetical protein
MGKLINITDQRFGFWVVKARGDNAKNGHTQWLCVCECGNEKLVTSNSLRSGNSTSCGCNHTPDLVGQKFGKLKVIQLEVSEDKTRRYWLCQCKCGNTITVSTYKLREKYTTSCGCDLCHKIKTVILTNEEIIKNIEEIIENNKKIIKSFIVKKIANDYGKVGCK